MKPIIATLSLVAAGAAHAHVGSPDAITHAGEHLWMLLALPALVFAIPLGRRLLQRSSRR